MICPPPYTGSITVLPEDIATLAYFKTTKISEWSLESFLASTGLTEQEFMFELRTIARIKRLPVEIQLFATRLKHYYGGVFQYEVTEIAKNIARKNVHRALLSGKEHLLLQSQVNDSLERDECTSSLRKRSQPLPCEGPVSSSSLHAENSKASSSGAATSNVLTTEGLSTEELLAEIKANVGHVKSDGKKPGSSKLSTSGVTSGRKKSAYTTEEPWRSLTFALIDVMNGKNNVSFPEQLPGMDHVHSLLFDHAVNSLKQYQRQDAQNKDIILVKDAQVAMSCVLNTMSKRACEHLEELEQRQLVETAKTLSTIGGFEQHECSAVLQRYAPILVKDGIPKLMAKLILDRGSIAEKYQDQERLPAGVDLEDKVLQILIILCQFILRPPFGKIAPSENDCLLIWMSIFSVIMDKLTMHTGEKVLVSSKTIRQRQTAEFSDVSDSGRKVDLLFMYNGVEVSNIEFKKPGTAERDLAIQNRKNVRLARCIQEAHAALGIENPSVMMADIAGFVGTVYQVKPMGEIAIAGETTSSMMYLPQTRGGLEAFMEDSSLALMWNYISRLETQGQLISNAKERHEITMDKAKFARGMSAMNPNSSQPTVHKRFQNNVLLTPSKKRVRVVVPSETPLDLSDQSCPPSPSGRTRHQH